RRLTIISSESDDADTTVTGRNFAQHRQTSVRRSIVDVNYFRAPAKLRQRTIELLMQRPQVWLFVKNWQENRDFQALIVAPSRAAGRLRPCFNFSGNQIPLPGTDDSKLKQAGLQYRKEVAAG